MSGGGAGRRQAAASRSLNICASYFKAKMFKRILPSTDPLQPHKANVKQMSWEKRRGSTLYRAEIQDRWKGRIPIPSRSLASVLASFPHTYSLPSRAPSSHEQMDRVRRPHLTSGGG